MNLLDKNERPMMLPGCIKSYGDQEFEKKPCMKKCPWAGRVAGKRNTHFSLDKKLYPCFE